MYKADLKHRSIEELAAIVGLSITKAKQFGKSILIDMIIDNEPDALSI